MDFIEKEIRRRKLGFFSKKLQRLQPTKGKRRWIFIPYDQLSDAIGPLSRKSPCDLGIILVESQWKAAHRPYHKQKLALILTNLRHFALEQAKRGVAVKYVISRKPYYKVLEPLIPELGPIQVMIPAKHELRSDLKRLAMEGCNPFLRMP